MGWTSNDSSSNLKGGTTRGGRSKLRTAKTRGCLSRQTMLTMVFKLCLSAEKRWRRLQGYRRLGEVIENVKFINGVREDEIAA